MEITIKGKDKKLLQLIEQLAKELGLSTSSSTKSKGVDHKNNGEKLYKLMKEMAESNAFSSIKDPVAWQREIRKDRPLPGRK